MITEVLTDVILPELKLTACNLTNQIYILKKINPTETKWKLEITRCYPIWRNTNVDYPTQTKLLTYCNILKQFAVEFDQVKRKTYLAPNLKLKEIGTKIKLQGLKNKL